MKMRKLLLGIIPFLLSGCIKEDQSDCTGNIYFAFSYEKDTQQLEQVEHDLYFQLYHSDRLYAVNVFPFKKVAGGKYYAILKEYTGEIEAIAWSVPVAEVTSGRIPQGLLGEKKEEGRIELELLPDKGDRIYKPMNFLHRASLAWNEEEINRDTFFSLSLSPAVCTLWITLYDGNGNSSQTAPGVEITGLQKELSYDLDPLGPDVVIWGGSGMVYKENRWGSGNIFLPPSLPEKTLSVKIIPSTGSAYIVHTNYVSVAGDLIHLEITAGGIRFFVNGWRRENLYVESL